MLTATPEVRIQNVTEEDEFVVLGCDGLWDAARRVARELNDHGDLQRAARAVTLRRGDPRRAQPRRRGRDARGAHQNALLHDRGPGSWRTSRRALFFAVVLGCDGPVTSGTRSRRGRGIFIVRAPKLNSGSGLCLLLPPLRAAPERPRLPR